MSVSTTAIRIASSNIRVGLNETPNSSVYVAVPVRAESRLGDAANPQA